jgi:2-keto-4-pentenoate hydratase/2-oxohepta-3-ene-1,7-dioic acid hydratase in catechol pathway
MKFATFQAGGRQSWGAVVDAGIVDLQKRLQLTGVAEMLRAGALQRAADVLRTASADIPLADVQLLPPVDGPGKIICVGVNYANRNEEYRDGAEAAKFPSLFMRTPGSLVGHREALLRPPESPQLDYEGEIVAVIGTAGRRIAEDRAANHIAGLTCGNEGTIRDWLRHSKFNVTQGKNFDRSGSVGPFLVTLDELPPLDALRVATRVNGEVRQDDSTDNMIFPIARLVSYISTFTTLLPGDVIFTGTPTGAGARFNPPRYLVPGDVVEVEVPGIGLLSNPVIDEVPA